MIIEKHIRESVIRHWLTHRSIAAATIAGYLATIYLSDKYRHISYGLICTDNKVAARAEKKSSIGKKTERKSIKHKMHSVKINTFEMHDKHGKAPYHSALQAIHLLSHGSLVLAANFICSEVIESKSEFRQFGRGN